jgi:TolB-like protein/Tfp pilus assembly protein PilF
MVYELGPFRLDTEARVLTLDGVATSLGARGVAVLAALVSRAGEYVEKKIIVEAAWPDVVVEEANLAVQISAIRRVLAHVPRGEHWIETLARRGYRFVGPVVRRPEQAHGVAAPANQRPSIAVLPFANRSSIAEDEYFSDGLADELINVLAKIRGLRVAARTSSFQFKGNNDDIAAIGRKLNVGTVLEGSVRKIGSRMRVSVQLVNVADGYHLWSETYDRSFDDIFAVQDEIAQSVVHELRAMLLGEASDANAGQQLAAQVAAAAKGRASNPEAHRLFLQARYLGQRFNREDATRAVGYLNEALSLDTQFAAAWAELGGQYTMQAGFGWAPAAESLARARDAVARALALEPNLAEVHARMAVLQMLDWNWRAAEASYRRALELAPGLALVQQLGGELALLQGRFDEAIRLYGHALDHDPLRPAVFARLAQAQLACGRAQQAETTFRTALEFGPQRISLHARLSVALLAQDRGAEALAEALREPEEWERLCALAIIHEHQGRRADSDAALDALMAKHRHAGAFQIAVVYAARNEVELAFHWLKQAYERRDSGLTELKIWPPLRSLYADPRWETLLHRIGMTN